MFFHNAGKNLDYTSVKKLTGIEERKSKLKINTINVSHTKAFRMVKLNTAHQSTNSNDGRFINILFRRLRSYNDNEVAENVFILNFILQLTALPNYLNANSAEVNCRSVLDEVLLVSTLGEVKAAAKTARAAPPKLRQHGKGVLHPRAASQQIPQLEPEVQIQKVEKELTVSLSLIEVEF